jgi:hypothetical protein
VSRFKIGDEVVIHMDGRDSDPYWVGRHGTVCDVLPVKDGHIVPSVSFYVSDADTWDVQVNVEDLFDGELGSAPWFDETELELA